MSNTKEWKDVESVIRQRLDAIDNELVEWELKIARLRDEPNLSEATKGAVTDRYIGHLVEALEKYHAMWEAHDILHSLYFDNEELEAYGIYMEPEGEE